MRKEAPSVLVVLVAKDGAAWVRRSLASLARQTHPRLGVLAVDNASTDPTPDVLVEALGERRVLRLPRNIGFAGAVARALDTPVARKADYVLLLHDDTALAPAAVAALVGAASAPGVGVVGPKVVDWDQPRLLREVGLTTDRFGLPYSPLEEGEIDQGQYDATRDVLFVSSTAMLVSTETWRRVGKPDERLGSRADLDLCWRARLAGFRVLVHPAAVALHREAGERGMRRGSTGARVRMYEERAALTAAIKCYRGTVLAWVLPIHLAQSAARMVAFLLTRRLGSAWHVAAAWGWNAAHLLGTVRRRARAQAVRRARDRDVTRLMVPSGARLRRLVGQAASALFPARPRPVAELGEEPPARPVVGRVARFAAARPAALALLVGMALTAVAFREVLLAGRLEGGALPLFPRRPGDLLSAFAAPWRRTGLGGPAGASPALVPLGLASYLTLADPRLLARLLVAATPLLAGLSCYRAARRAVGDQAGAAVAAACYAASGLVLWAASGGRVGAAALLVAAPWLLVRLREAFEPRPPGGTREGIRWVVGTGMGLALAVSFFPAARWAAALAVVAAAAVPGSLRALGRGLALSAAAAAAAAALVFPFALDLVRLGGGAAVGAAGVPEAGAVLRLAPGPAPGTWAPALFLPVAGALGFGLAEDRRWAWRAALAGAASLPLAWLAAAGWLPPELSNPVVYLAVAASSLSLLAGLGTASALPALGRGAFGARQVAFAALCSVLAVGLVLQAGRASVGGWAVGKDRVTPAWPVVGTAPPPDFRVLWLGRAGGAAFPAPGGEPDGWVEAGPASVRYAVTGRLGASVLDLGLPVGGRAHAALERAVSAMLDGSERHVGALLAPFGIRFVVAGRSDLPQGAARRLAQQVDLDLVQWAGGLLVYRSADPLPVAAAVGPEGVAAARSDLPGAGAQVGDARPIPSAPGGWAGPVGRTGPGGVLVATEFDPRWRLRGDHGSAVPFRSFGWALGFEASFPARVRVELTGGWVRAVQLAAMGLLWVLALWLTRRGAPADGR